MKARHLVDWLWTAFGSSADADVLQRELSMPSPASPHVHAIDAHLPPSFMRLRLQGLKILLDKITKNLAQK
jgi:hypothetical protein